MHPHSKGCQQPPGLDQECCQQFEGGDPSPLFSTGEAAPAGLDSVMGSHYKKDTDLMVKMMLQQN